MSIVSQNGTVLVDAEFGDSEEGPRPTRRADIVTTLAASLPEGTIRYNSALASVHQDADGGARRNDSLALVLYWTCDLFT